MKPASKLRVATPDVADALDAMKVEVEGATGFAVEQEFQEIDRAELVVEMRLTGSHSAEPALVTRAIERSTRGLDVLSIWREAPVTREPAPVSSQAVFNVLDASMPEVARRALRDEIPTARWHEAIDGEATGDHSCWELAVPVVRPDGQSIVGLKRRRGYTVRFSIHDATAVRVGLAS